MMTLRAARINKGLTQAQAAKRIGVSADTLRRYEKARSFPDVPVIHRMEEVYGVSYNELLFLPQNYGLTVCDDGETV